MLARSLLMLFVLVFGAGSAFAQGDVPAEPKDSGLTVDQLLAPLPGDIILGDKNAKVTIIEYASMTCSHCAAFHNGTFPELKEKYIDTGKVKFIFRDFPLDEQALRAAMMARCAAKGGDENFMKFVKAIFSSQSNWAGKKNYLEILSNIGKLGGFKTEEFESCIADKKIEEEIMSGRFDAAKKLDVRSTPTFFVNKEILRGGHDINYLSGVIDGLLDGKKESTQDKEKEIKN